MQQINATQITHKIIKLFKESKEDNFKAIIDKKSEELIFSWIPKDLENPPFCEEISISQLKEKVFQKVTQNLKTTGKIFVYSCKDESLISLETEVSQDEEEDFYNEIQPGLFVGFD